jgi:CRP-like cAMP-binding protein
MSRQSILSAFSAVPHWRALPPELLAELASASRWREYAAAAPIFRQGQPARAFFVIARGSVRVYRSTPDGHEQLVHHLRPGASFAEPAVLTIGVYPAHANALEAGTALVEVGAARFLELFRSDARMSGVIVAALCSRMLDLVDRIEDLSVIGAEARLARYLLRLPSKRGAKGGCSVRLPMPKQELALQLAMTPETFSRLLRRWSETGRVRVAGAQLELLEVDAWVALADGRLS